jgi:acyl carrier protein phosphodiesterase
MNYLAHAYLSFGDPLILAGNMAGDHVKGKLALAKYPERMQEGLMLHREIDAFADAHPAAMRAAMLFRADYGLYAGAIIDSLMDHFLANDAKLFSSVSQLKRFSEETYAQLETVKQHLPEGFLTYLPHMKEHNWLYNYRTLQGVQRSLGGLSRRAKYMRDPAKAYEIFVGYYYILGQCYYELMDAMIPMVKSRVQF